MSENGSPSSQTLSTTLFLATVLHVLALILTSFRLWFRYHIRRLWWDDALAALALLCDIVCLVGMWSYAAPLTGNEPYIIFGALTIPAQSRDAHVISFWLGVLFYTCAIWFARVSIVCSVTRIVPPARNTTVMVWSAALTFICMLVYVFTSKMIVCSLDESWYYTNIECPIPKWVALSEVCTDALSDVILVVIPLYLLWDVKLPKNQKIMVLSIFSTSILVTAVSVVHTAYLIVGVTFIEGVTAQIEGAVSLIVCNLLVIVMFIYRIIKNGEDLTAGVPSDRLTTVDLGVSGGSLFTSTAVATVTESSCSGSAGLTGTRVSSVRFASVNHKNTSSGCPTTDGSIGAPSPATVNRGTGLPSNTLA